MYVLIQIQVRTCTYKYIHVHVHGVTSDTIYMNNHLYRTPQCTKERIRKRKRKKEDTLTYEYTTTPFPPHTQQPQWLRNCTTLPTC